MKSALIIICALLVAVFAVAYFYFAGLTGSSRLSSKALSYIPVNSLSVVSFKNESSFYETFKNYRPLAALAGESKTKEVLDLRNVLFTKPAIFKIFNQGQVYASLHAGKDSVDILWIATLNPKFSKKEILEEFAKAGRIRQSADFYSLSITPKNKEFYFYAEAGFAIGSFSSNLIGSALNAKQPKISESFIKEISEESLSAGNSPLSLFINHNTLSSASGHIFSAGKASSYNFFESIRGVSTLNLNFKSDALMFNGITSPDTGKSEYLNIFLKQTAGENSLKKIITKNTATFLDFSFSNREKFSAELRRVLEKRKQLNKLETQVKNIATTTGINPNRDIEKNLGKEFALVQLSNLEKLALIKSTNGSNLNFALQELSSPYSEYIRRLNHSNIFYYFYGDPLKEFARPFYAVVDNYLIISNSARAVNQFYGDYVAGNFLTADSSFTAFNMFLAGKSNMLYFVHNKNSRLLKKRVLNNSYHSISEVSKLQTEKPYGFSLQFTSDKDRFFTNFYAPVP